MKFNIVEDGYIDFTKYIKFKGDLRQIKFKTIDEMAEYLNSGIEAGSDIMRASLKPISGSGSRSGQLKESTSKLTKKLNKTLDGVRSMMMEEGGADLIVEEFKEIFKAADASFSQFKRSEAIHTGIRCILIFLTMVVGCYLATRPTVMNTPALSVLVSATVIYINSSLMMFGNVNRDMVVLSTVKKLTTQIFTVVEGNLNLMEELKKKKKGDEELEESAGGVELEYA